MSERTRLLDEAFRRVGNPFIVCELVSQRARQLLSTDAQWDDREAITQALRELAAQSLEFQIPNGVAQGLPSTAGASKQAGEVQGVQVPSRVKEAGVEASTR